MRVEEFANAQDQLDLWKKVSDAVWAGINAQRQQQGVELMRQRPAQNRLVDLDQIIRSPVKPAGHAANGFVIPIGRSTVFAMVLNAGVMPYAGKHRV